MFVQVGYRRASTVHHCHQRKSSNKQNVIATRSNAQCSGAVQKRGREGLKVLLQLAYKISNFFPAAPVAAQRRDGRWGKGIVLI